jgi:hypothetical protein
MSQDLTIQQRIEERFTYHSPTPDQIPQYEAIRAKAKELAQVIVDNTPEGPDRTVALRELEAAVMTANKGIACRGIAWR